MGAWPRRRRYAFRRSGWRLIQEARSGDAERRREFIENEDRRVSSAPLNVADISAVNAGLLGIGFLAPTLCLAKATKVATEALANIHTRNEARPSLIDLQTMRDIFR